MIFLISFSVFIFAPHFSQNFAPAAISAPQSEHFIYLILSVILRRLIGVKRVLLYFMESLRVVVDKIANADERKN